MGFIAWLKGLFSRNKKDVVATPTPTKTETVAVVASSNGAAAADATADLQPQCAALTAAGGQCKRSARHTSKYCGSHKGYRPPTAAVAAAAKDTKPAVKGAKDTAPTARKASTSTPAARPQCGALTAAGGQCKSSARQASKYCGRHKGYRPPTAAVAAKAKDTKPAAKKARDTAPAARRTVYKEGDYALYKKGNRYNFSKKTQKEMKDQGFTPVFEIPSGKTVGSMPNGVPVLKNA